MSENQASPPAPDPALILSVDSQPDTAPVESIEKSHMLSPVSPHPVHVAEPSDIPVLKNQMDPEFNSTSAHVRPSSDPPNGVSTTAIESLDANSYDPESLSSYITQQQQASSAASSTINQETSPSFAIGAPAQDTTAPSVDSGNGNVPAVNGTISVFEASQTNEVVVNKEAKSPDTSSASGTSPKTYTYSLPTNLASNVDLQALLTKLSPNTVQQPVSPKNNQQSTPDTTTATPAAAAPSSAQVSPSQARAPSLPAPPQNPATQSQNSVLNHQPTHPLPPTPVTSAVSSGINQSAGYPASLPPPPNFNQHRQAVPKSPSVTEETEEDNRPFTAEEEEEYNRFLTDERDYVTQGQWDRFPAGSRLFIGNLPTEKVTKRDLFRIFHKHGRLAQVSIKQAYGFVQFLDTKSCAAALRAEQGSSVRGRKMHLEVSKPQRSTRPSGSEIPLQTGRAGGRSHSPDYGRPASPRGRGGSSFRGGREIVERGFSRSRDPRDRDHDYGSRRSPPRTYRLRDDYRPPRRDRSRSPPARYRQRSPSPDRDDIALPRRAPHEVPEVQIIATDDPDRNFIWWVERAFIDRQLKCDVMFLNPRFSLAAVVRQYILEGVQGVVFLNRQMQQESKISIQVFDRRGQGEANYDQYDNIDPQIGAELVIRAKIAHAPQPPQQQPIQTYGGYTVPPQTQAQVQTPIAAAGIPNLASILGALDPTTLQKLLSGLQQQQPLPQHQPQQHGIPPQQQQIGPDLAALLTAGARHSASQTPTPVPAAPPAYTNGGYAANAGLAALLAQRPQHTPVQHAVQQSMQAPGQMQNIMETLAKWKQS